jgi:hypothetical protein
LENPKRFAFFMNYSKLLSAFLFRHHFDEEYSGYEEYDRNSPHNRAAKDSAQGST